MVLSRAFLLGWVGSGIARVFSATIGVLLAGWLSLDFLQWLGAKDMPVDSSALTVVAFIFASAGSLYWTLNHLLPPILRASTAERGGGEQVSIGETMSAGVIPVRGLAWQAAGKGAAKGNAKHQHRKHYKKKKRNRVAGVGG